MRQMLVVMVVLVLAGAGSSGAQGPTSSGDVDCDGNVDISDVTLLIDNLFINRVPLCPVQLCSTTTVDFEDVPQWMKDNGLVTVYKGISFDTLINGQIQGWNCYNALSLPHSGGQFLINRHGAGDIGFTFPQDVLYYGAWFAKATQHAGIPDQYAAQRLRYHFYDSTMTEIGVTDWLTLTDTPQWFPAARVVRRVVVEHGRDVPYYDDSPWETKANYFSMDDLTYSLIK